jgi:hypothetical protein
MTKLLVSVLMLLTVSVGLAAQEWTRFSPPGCRCSVSTPVKLQSSPQPVDTKVGTYTVSIFQGTTGSVTYVIAWVDYAATVKLDIQGELEANRDNFIKGVGATLLETTPISLKGSPGILFTAEKDTLFYTSRVYVVGRRPYQLLVATRKGEDHAAEISKFFSSFEVSAPSASKGY